MLSIRNALAVLNEPGEDAALEANDSRKKMNEEFAQFTNVSIKASTGKVGDAVYTGGVVGALRRSAAPVDVFRAVVPLEAHGAITAVCYCRVLTPANIYQILFILTKLL